ncbi:MAG: DUF1684 domain-containing protein [Acidobacteria bacterium]|nr:DUF1684 domain-containing protein [Acidobacteriota bacterium]
MKALVLITLLFGALAAGARAQTAYDPAAVESFRATRDRAFRSANESPLRREDFAKFDGLKYFEIGAKYAVRAKFEKTTDETVFMMPTSTGTPRKYFKIGVLKFELDGQSFSLAAFLSETALKKSDAPLFVPFRDLTSGRETYGGGRYLNIKITSGDDAWLDFNFAYNPSCAYGDESFSCALPPKENYLATEIKAGEKSFPRFDDRK